MTTATSKSAFGVGARWAAGVVSALFLVWAIVSIVRVGTIFWIFSDIAAWFDTNLNIDDRASTFLAVLLTAAAVPLLPLVASFVFWGRHQRELLFVAVIAAAIMGGLLYGYGDDVFFDHRTGKPIRYYADTPSGIVLSRSPGFDKKFGIAKKPVTPQIIQSLEKEKSGIRPRRISLTADGEIEFFNTADGKAKVWYCRAPNGVIELFDGPGFHPQRREPLIAITPDVVDALERAKSKQRAEVAARAKSEQEESARRQREQERALSDAARAESARQNAAAAAERSRQEVANAEALRQRRAQEEARRLSERELRPNIAVAPVRPAFAPGVGAVRMGFLESVNYSAGNYRFTVKLDDGPFIHVVQNENVQPNERWRPGDRIQVISQGGQTYVSR